MGTFRFFDFRDTPTFVTDPANSTYVRNSDFTDPYPVVRDGFSFGYPAVAQAGAADRSATNPPHLAGVHYCSNAAGTNTFRLDLTAFGGPGTYKIGLALGDTGFPNGNTNMNVYDGATLLFGVSVNQTVDATYFDANGISHTAANWEADQTYKTVTVAGSTIDFIYGGGTAGDYSKFACLYVEFLPSGPPTPMLFHSFRSPGRVRRR